MHLHSQCYLFRFIVCVLNFIVIMKNFLFFFFLVFFFPQRFTWFCPGLLISFLFSMLCSFTTLQKDLDEDLALLNLSLCVLLIGCFSELYVWEWHSIPTGLRSGRPRDTFHLASKLVIFFFNSPAHSTVR